jgi:AcrR family transcriptional regulator
MAGGARQARVVLHRSYFTACREAADTLGAGMSPRRKLSDARRQQILQAAVHVIAEQGLCDTGIKEVAERAGTSPALVIYYFGRKDALLGEAQAFAEQRFYGDTASALAELSSARERLVRLVQLSCAVGDGPDSFQEEWVLWLDLWARAPRDPGVARDREALDRRWRQTIAGIVRQGQEAGEFAPVDADDFSLLLAALIDGLAIQVVLGDPEVPAERMFDLCMATCARELGFGWDADDRARVLGSAVSGAG